MIHALKRLLVIMFPRLSKIFKSRVIIPLQARRSSAIFKRIYLRNEWNNPDSRSGDGSSLLATEFIRANLPTALKDLHITSLLDAPCGDFHWMKECDMQNIQYFGGDIVPLIVEQNQKAYSSSSRQFMVIDIIKDSLPNVDALFCRDCLIHLSNFQIDAFLKNLKRSSVQYLFVTNQPLYPENRDISVGQWRPVDLTKPPFSLPAPLRIIDDYRPGHFEDDFGKNISIWKVQSL